MITATPWSRSSTIRRCTNSIEPTSRPRVGWLASSSRTRRPTSRARITFCWLPPDSVPTGVSIEEVRTSNSATRLLAFSRMAGRSIAIPLAYGGRS